MNNLENEKLLDLLTKHATEGLDELERSELDKLFPEWESDNSFEFAASAIGLTYLEIEPMPGHLKAKILNDAEKYFPADTQKTFEFEPGNSSWNWLGWAVAGFASIALAITLFFPRTIQMPPPDQAKNPPAMKIDSPFELRQKLLDSDKNLYQAKWGAGNVKEINEIAGDIIWSDREQKGYMRFSGLPSNDQSKECYQLWIFDETQSDKTPIDGGVFDVAANGEVIIPIDAKLKVKGPKMFAITIEKPGGVVVSDRKKIAALAKIQI